MDNTTLYRIEQFGAKVYFFGECVWSTLLNLPVKHYKIAVVGGEPSQVLPLFEEYSPTIVKHTIQLTENNKLYEFFFPVTFDAIPKDPIAINNAILALDGTLYRAEDITSRTLNVRSEVFLDNPGELLRLCRIHAQTSFRINVATWVGMKENARLIKNVVKSEPRFVGQQLDEILQTPRPSLGFKLMQQTGILTHVLPELSLCEEISQTRRGENTNVFQHTMLTLDASAPERIIRWTMLFHDAAKPITMEVSEDGKMHFFKHEIIGARLAETYMSRYKLPKTLITRVKNLIENHMFDADPKLTPKGVRRLIRRVGKEHIHDLIKVREADRRGATSPPPMDKIELLKQKINKELPNVT